MPNETHPLLNDDDVDSVYEQDEQENMLLEDDDVDEPFDDDHDDDDSQQKLLLDDTQQPTSSIGSTSLPNTPSGGGGGGQLLLAPGGGGGGDSSTGGGGLQSKGSAYSDLLHPSASLYPTDSMYSSDIELSSEDTISQEGAAFEESFLVQQQNKVAVDFRKQEEHENQLRIMYEYMKSRKKKRKKKITRRIKNCCAGITGRISHWILKPDKLWFDMLYVILCYFQLAGLIWLFPYTYPINVYRLTQFTIYFNLDFVSRRNDDGTSNLISSGLHNPPFYPFYLTPWLIIPPLLFILWIFLPRLKSIRFFRRFIFEIDRILFTILRLLYIPFLIHTWAYGFCGGEGLSAFQCRPFCADEFGWCLTRSIPALIGTLIYGVGMPIMFCYEAKKLIVYARNVKHMNYLNNVEVEKDLNISNNYVIYRFHMISSYTRLGSFYVFIKEAVQKGTLVFIWAVLDGRDNAGQLSWRTGIAISSFAFAVFIGPLVIELMWRPYRNLSYFLLTQMLGWTHVFNVMLAWFLALGVQSPFLLPTQLTILVTMTNVFMLACTFITICTMFVLKVKWPINERVVKELETQYAHYLKAIRDGYMLYAHALTTNPSFVRCDLLIHHKEYLQKLYQESILEGNPLEETIEDCILKLEEEYFANQQLSLLPHKPLQEHLPLLRKQMDRRQTEMILIPPRKRILLFKLLAIRHILGNVPVKRVPIGEEPDTYVSPHHTHRSGSEGETDEERSEKSLDLSTLDKLQAFLAQHDIILGSSSDEEEEEKEDDIDRLLAEVGSDDDEKSNDQESAQHPHSVREGDEEDEKSNVHDDEGENLLLMDDE